MMSIDMFAELRIALVVLFFASVSSFPNPCSVCEDDGASVSTPDKVIDFVPNVPALTCRELESLTQTAFEADTDACNLVHSLSTVCGCPIAEEACFLCHDGAPVSDDYRAVLLDLPVYTSLFDAPEGFLPSCQLVEGYLHSRSAQDELCRYAQQTAGVELCGCRQTESNNNGTNATVFDPGIFNNTSGGTAPISGFSGYSARLFGVRSPEDLEYQKRVHRASAILSIIAALVVVLDNLRTKKRWKNLYNKIVTSMALFDIICSIARALLDSLRPDAGDVFVGQEADVVALCRAQGWFLMWGQSTSLFLNASLSTYYLIVIVSCFTETSLRKSEKYLLGIPLLLGFVFACASLPFIWFGTGTPCFVIHPSYSGVLASLGIIDYDAGWGPTLGLVVIPILLVLLFATLTMIRVYWYVRQIEERSQSWNRQLPPTYNGDSSTTPSLRNGLQRTLSTLTTPRRNVPRATLHLRKEVAWQSLLYLSALYATWGFYAIVQLTLESYAQDHFHFWNLYYFMVSFQGFMNACVYFRPRISRRWSLLREARKGRRMAAECQQPDNSPSRQGLRRRCCLPRCGGSDDANVEPVVELVALNSVEERNSQDTIETTNNYPRTGVDDDDPIDDDAADDDAVLAPTARSLDEALDSETLRQADDDKLAVNFSEIAVAAAENEIVDQDPENTTESSGRPSLEESGRDRSRRASLQILMGALAGIHEEDLPRESGD